MPKLPKVIDVINIGDLVKDVPFNHIDDLRTIPIINGTIKIDTGSNDTLTGTSFSDVITVHNGNDTVHAGGGNDILKDLAGGNDQLFGEAGNDKFVLGTGADTADGGDGIDTVDYTGIDFTVVADLKLGFAFAEGIDQLVSIENLIGSDWNDTITGNGVANVLYGMGGNDKINGGDNGGDSLFGGAGNDTLTGGGGLYGGTGNDTLISMTRPAFATGDLQYGEAGNDTMFGSRSADKMFGGSGNDVMFGRSGDDLIHGGSGFNTMTGGTGDDVFVFEPFNTGHRYDRIMDFKPGQDKIDVSDIDADPLTDGDQAFHLHRGPRFNHDGIIHTNPGPLLNGFGGAIDIVRDHGNTYIYVETKDGLAQADIVLKGELKLTADDFIFLS